MRELVSKGDPVFLYEDLNTEKIYTVVRSCKTWSEDQFVSESSVRHEPLFPSHTSDSILAIYVLKMWHHSYCGSVLARQFIVTIDINTMYCTVAYS